MATPSVTAEIFSRPGAAWRWRIADARARGWELVTISIVDGMVNARIQRRITAQATA